MRCGLIRLDKAIPRGETEESSVGVLAVDPIFVERVAVFVAVMAEIEEALQLQDFRPLLPRGREAEDIGLVWLVDEVRG